MNAIELADWLPIGKHLLVIGELPMGITCSVCNLYSLTETRDLHCYKCQLAYLYGVRHLDRREDSCITSDGYIAVTIFHLVGGDFSLYTEYLS